MTTVPLMDLATPHREIAEEIRAGFERVMSATAFVKGPEVAAFEREYAEFQRVSHCVGVANGTDAIELALRAVGVGPDVPVVLPANTFVATAGAVLRCGARPILCDVDPQYLLMDPAALFDVLTEDTAAIVPVHLYGQMAPMSEIMGLAGRIPVIEDAAQSQGAAQGGRTIFGSLAATSFYPGKNLGAYGDAGAVTTDDDELQRQVRLIADHGSEKKYEHLVPGVNSRLDALQAVVLRAKLARLAAGNEARRAAAARYAELLGDLDEVQLPATAPDNTHVWHLYVIRVAERARVMASLAEQGIQTGIHYPKPVHLHPAYRSLGYAPGDFPVSEAAAEEIVSLPMFPHITEEQQALVADALRKALR
ncbi:DegT/DnrJ/EryC1/StrS family aminotransferase [Rhizohabitans arisaemae]|uniref:DegT/DnrJ/EryC1/StrS family aminotransferase n=1 Tax=Rhizohabitans arisaemae TaxID=2720610 RepID=UPI0024B15DF6|nr:DegT/DnrJ/EryC1/StrS family aminotransferase [Rhizohabitans arisaemae]